MTSAPITAEWADIEIDFDEANVNHNGEPVEHTQPRDEKIVRK